MEQTLSKKAYKVTENYHRTKMQKEIELDDNTCCQLSAQNWYKVISEGLKACGYIDEQKISRVLVEPCTNDCC